LRYIFLTPAEEEQLRALEASGVEVTAQDVPSARAVPLSEILEGESK
jgi:PTS system mannose-specific IIB component/fructoselysine and glucoselysine-specific PTS system IIB component